MNSSEENRKEITGIIHKWMMTANRDTPGTGIYAGYCTSELLKLSIIKEELKPKIYLICTACLQAFSMDVQSQHTCHHPNPHLIRVQEVVDE